MMTSASAERVSIEEVKESDNVMVPPDALTTLTVDSVDHVLGSEHLGRSTSEPSVDEGRSAVATLNTDIGDQMMQEYEAQLQTLGDFQLEQLENVQVAIKVFLTFMFRDLLVCLSGFGLHVCMCRTLLQPSAVCLAA